jgi:hypothetical protein
MAFKVELEDLVPAGRVEQLVQNLQQLGMGRAPERPRLEEPERALDRR